MTTEIRIFRRHDQRKVLFPQPIKQGDPDPLFSFRPRLQALIPLMELIAHHLATTQLLKMVDPITQEPAHQACLTIFTTLRTNIHRLTRRIITDTLKPPVISQTLYLLPDPLIQILQYKTITHKYLSKLNPNTLLRISHTQSVPIHFQITFLTHILPPIIIFSIMITQMTNIHILQAFTHTIHRPRTTNCTLAHHIQHTLIITDREVCTRLDGTPTVTIT